MIIWLTLAVEFRNSTPRQDLLTYLIIPRFLCICTYIMAPQVLHRQTLNENVRWLVCASIYGRLRHTHTIHTIHILYVCNVTVMEYALTIAKGVYMSSPSAATNIKQVNIYTKTQSFYLPMFVWEDEWEI